MAKRPRRRFDDDERDRPGLAFRELYTPEDEGPLPPRPRPSGKGGPSVNQTPVVTTSTWSAADATASGMTLSNGGMTVTGPAGWNSIRTTQSRSSGKYYVEFLAVVSSCEIGVANAGFTVGGNYLGAATYSAGALNNSNYVSAGFTSNYSTSGLGFGPGDVAMIAVDFAGSIWFGKNGVWTDSSNPATGSLPVISFTPATVGALFPALAIINAGTQWTLQPTAASQKYAPPAGFVAWDTGPPVLTTAPSISGTQTVGSVLSCAHGSWTNSPTYAYQWVRNGTTNISGATSSSYTTVVADGAASLTCVVTASNGAGSASATSNALLIQGPPVNTLAPQATGTLTVGSTLSCTSGNWTGSPGYAYQWQRNGANISGATSSSYVTVTADGGTNVACVVTATNAAGSASATSNALAIAAASGGSTWSAADAATGSYTLSNANMTATSGKTNWQTIRGTISQSAGKFYVEFKFNTAQTNNQEWGVADATFVVANGNYVGSLTYSCGMAAGGNYVSAGFTKNYSVSDTVASGDVVGLAIDFTAGSIWMARNNIWVNSSNPATGSLPWFSFVPATVGALFPAAGFYLGGVVTLQPAVANQTYLPPPGFQAWDGGPVTPGAAWTPTSMTGLVAWYDAQDAATLTTASAVTAHRYWRLDNLTHGLGSAFAFAEMQFRTTAGVPLLFSGGTATASDTYSGQPGPYDATHLVDNDPNTLWSGDPLASGPHWVQYDYGAGVTKAIVEITVTSRNDSSFPQAPLTFDLAYSDNGTSWTVLQTFTAAPWTQGQTQTFTVNRNVSQWNDKSGHAYNATQATGANQPGYGATLLNGLPALTFNGNTSRMSASASGQPFALGIAHGIVNVSASTNSAKGGGFALENSLLAAPYYIFNGSIYFGNGTTHNGFGLDGLWGNSGAGQIVEANYIKSADVYTDWINGAQFSTIAAGGGISTVYGQPAGAVTITIGGRSDASSLLYGLIGEIVLANGMATTDRQKLEGYLAWKWNLQDNLPPGHPFLAGPPDTSGAPMPKPWYPKLLPGLVSWWDAQDASTITQNNGQVSQWNDKSGNGHHAVQAATANQPTYNVSGMGGKPDIAFSFGGSTAMQAPCPSGIFSAGISVFYVCTVTPNTDRAGIFGRWVGDNPGAWGCFYFKIFLGPTYLITAGTPLSLNTFSSPTLCGATYVQSTDLYYEYTNGTQVYGSGTAQGAASTYNDTATSFSFGASGTGNFCCDGTLGEVITCTSVTTADRQKIEGYLAWKWGLQGSLPAGHPYKSAPP